MEALQNANYRTTAQRERREMIRMLSKMASIYDQFIMMVYIDSNELLCIQRNISASAGFPTVTHIESKNAGGGSNIKSLVRRKLVWEGEREEISNIAV